jgi:hypothetical protein
MRMIAFNEAIFYILYMQKRYTAALSISNSFPYILYMQKRYTAALSILNSFSYVFAHKKKNTIAPTDSLTAYIQRHASDALVYSEKGAHCTA